MCIFDLMHILIFFRIYIYIKHMILYKNDLTDIQHISRNLFPA